jgi:hypothetical protein
MSQSEALPRLTIGDEERDMIKLVFPSGRARGPVQTAAIKIEGDVIRAMYDVRNPDKLRHLAPATAPPRTSLPRL